MYDVFTLDVFRESLDVRFDVQCVHDGTPQYSQLGYIYKSLNVKAAEQHRLPAPIPAAQIDVTCGHNILGEKRKLDQGKPSDIDAVDGDEGENHSINTALEERAFSPLRTLDRLCVTAASACVKVD